MKCFQAAICVIAIFSIYGSEANAQTLELEIDQTAYRDAPSGKRVPHQVKLTQQATVARTSIDFAGEEDPYGEDQWIAIDGEVTNSTGVADKFCQRRSVQIYRTFGGACRCTYDTMLECEGIAQFEKLRSEPPRSQPDRERYPKSDSPEGFILIDLNDTQLLGLAQQP